MRHRVEIVFYKADGSVMTERLGSPPNQGAIRLPGGRIEAGETPAEAAARELAEEYGLIVKPEVFWTGDTITIASDRKVTRVLVPWALAGASAGVCEGLRDISGDGTELVWSPSLPAPWSPGSLPRAGVEELPGQALAESLAQATAAHDYERLEELETGAAAGFADCVQRLQALRWNFSWDGAGAAVVGPFWPLAETVACAALGEPVQGVCVGDWCRCSQMPFGYISAYAGGTRVRPRVVVTLLHQYRSRREAAQLVFVDGGVRLTAFDPTHTMYSYFVPILAHVITTVRYQELPKYGDLDEYMLTSVSKLPGFPAGDIGIAVVESWRAEIAASRAGWKEPFAATASEKRDRLYLLTQ